MATRHTGRPLVRRGPRGGVSILCPFGHSVTYVRRQDWAGSQWEAAAGDPKYTVTCDGTIASEATR